MNTVREINEWEFDTAVLDAERPVLVDFYAPWCGPCRMLAPLLERMAAEWSERVDFVKVNVDEAPELALRYGITGVPTLLLFSKGLPVDRVVGLIQPQALEQRLAQVCLEHAARS
ncbi:MAG: thioredoxin [Limisphaera sp.]|nr:MAG: thioredoxin [Limisphaera sp.]